MQTSAELKAQLAQIEREIADIQRSLPRLTATQDLLDAHQEVQNRLSIKSLLQGRLEAAVEAERQAQAEKARLRIERDEVKAEIQQQRAAFDAKTAPWESQTYALLEELSTDAKKRAELERRYRSLSEKLNEHGSMTKDFGFSAEGEQLSVAKQALYMLFAERNKLPGSLSTAKEAMSTLTMQQLVAWGNLQTRGEEQDRNRDEIRLREHLNNL